jgi:hypothetical protein
VTASAVSSTHRRLGAYAIGIQLGLAGLIGWIVTANSDGAPEPVPRAVALACLYAVPAAVAWFGWRAPARTPLLAAAALDLAGSVVAFSGVTLVFLAPGLMLAAAAAGVPAGQRTASPLAGAALGIGIVVLGVASAVALLGLTEAVCWSAAGVVPFPSGGGVMISGDPGTTCSTGVLTAGGEGLAAALAIGAVGLAALAGRRRSPPPG